MGKSKHSFLIPTSSFLPFHTLLKQDETYPNYVTLEAWEVDNDTNFYR